MDSKSILNIENYKKSINDSENEIFNQYLKVMNKYNETVISSIHINKHDYFKYIYLKGIESLTHIFNMLLMYTKNLSLTYHHCEKSLFYYIEFIGQIGDDNHSFLQLSSKDAILFVYKKTIFDINDSYKKNLVNSNSDTKIINNTTLLTNAYKKCMNIYINTNNIDKLNEIDIRNNLYSDIFTITNKLFNNLNNTLKSKDKVIYLEYINKIFTALLNKKYNVNNEVFNYLFKTITKNIDKKKTIDNILNNIKSHDFDENYDNFMYVKTNTIN
jgi:hypothetical protein